jgi:hypothetical protein
MSYFLGTLYKNRKPYAAIQPKRVKLIGMSISGRARRLTDHQRHVRR